MLTKYRSYHIGNGMTLVHISPAIDTTLSKERRQIQQVSTVFWLFRFSPLPWNSEESGTIMMIQYTTMLQYMWSKMLRMADVAALHSPLGKLNLELNSLVAVYCSTCS